MTSPQRPRKSGTGQYPSIPTEALGLSIHPEASPPQANLQANLANTAQAPKQPRGSVIRNPNMPSAPPGASGLSQEVQPLYGPQPYGQSDPPSPSHTASPPSASSGFPVQTQQQQSPPQMPQSNPQLGAFQRSQQQNRVPPPNFDQNGGSNGRATDGGWATPPHPDDSLVDARGNRRKGSDERDEQQQQQGQIRDWERDHLRTANGSLQDAMALRSSPTSQAQQQAQAAANRGSSSIGPAANRNRPKGPMATSSSPVSSMTAAQRQQTQQQQQGQQQQQQQQQNTSPQSSASQVRKEPLQGLIAPHVSPPIPLLSRSQTENAGMAAVAAGVRPVLTPPSNYANMGNNNAASPPRRESSGSYHTPLDSPQNGDAGSINNGRTGYMSAVSTNTSYSNPGPFQYDNEDDQDPRAVRRSQMEEWKRKDPYGRDQSPSPLNLKNNQQAARDRERQPQRHPGGEMGNANVVGGGGGSQMRVMRFPVHEEPEFEDDGDVHLMPEPHSSQQQQQHQSQGMAPPARWVSNHHQQQQQQQNYPQDRDRDRRRGRDDDMKVPSPPPAEPVPHPPIPLFQPQSVQAGQPPLLQRDSTPSPPTGHSASNFRVNQSHPPEDDLEPAEASSDHHTPKSPNAPLPADHGYSYSNSNAGRYSYNPAQYGYNPNASPYGGLQHALFAMQMSGMPMPRGPMPNVPMQNYNARESFTSLGVAAAALTQPKPESPYPPPLPPPSINTSNLNGSSGGAKTGSGYNGSAERGSMYGDMNGGSGDPWEGIEQSYAEFLEYQRRFGSARPDAPIPPTPHSYTAPQGPQGRSQQGQGQGYNGGGGGNLGSNNNNSNNHAMSHAPNNGYGMGGVFDPSMIPDRYIPSALSSYLSSPMMHNPFLPRFPAPPSLVSSPSHIPLDLPGPPFPGRRLAKKKSKRQLRGQYGAGGPAAIAPAATKAISNGTNGTNKHGTSKLSQPPQMPEVAPRIGAESTVPGDTESEDESGTDGTKKGGPAQDRTKTSGTGSETKYAEETSGDEDEDDDVWLDESSEDELDCEYHSRYIQNPSKRKRKWEQKWDSMIRLFQEIDRTTDSPMILLAGPSTTSQPKTHILVSRAMLRNPAKFMPHAQVARQSFTQISTLRRKEKADAAEAERARRAMGFEAQLASAAYLGARFDYEGSGDSAGRGTGSSSPGSAGFGPTTLGALGERLKELPTLVEGGEEGLKQALSVAIDGMKQMHLIYEQREERRREEAERQRQEAEGLETLWKAAAFRLEPGANTGSPSSQGSGSASGRQLVLAGKKSP